jgi:hypothetical protein
MVSGLHLKARASQSYIADSNDHNGAITGLTWGGSFFADVLTVTGAAKMAMRLLLALYHLRRLRRLSYRLEGRPAPLGLMDLCAWLALWRLWPGQ